MDAIDWDKFCEEEWGQFRGSKPTPEGRSYWYATDDEAGSSSADWDLFMEHLKAGKPRAQAYLAEIIAWRMNRGDT